MARPRSTLCTITFEPGRPKPYRCRWRTSAGEKKAQSFATEAEALTFKAQYDGEQARIPAEPRVVKPVKPEATGAAQRHLDIANAPKGSLTVRQFGESWLASIVTDLKPGTYRSYEQSMRLHVFPIIGHARLHGERFTSDNVIALNTELKRRGANWPTRLLVLRHLSAMCTWAVLGRHLQSNPCWKLGGKLKPRDLESDVEPNPMTADQAAAFLDWVKTGGGFKGKRGHLVRAGRGYPELFEYFLVLLRTGMRRGEAAALRWADLDLDARVVHVRFSNSPSARQQGKKEDGRPKNGKQRDVYLSQQTVEALRDLKRRCQEACLKAGQPWDEFGLVFLLADGRRVRANSTSVDHALALGMKALKLSHTVHDLRDTYATLQLTRDPGRLFYVSRMLGHSSPEITLRRYTRWVPQGGTGHQFADELDDRQVASKGAKAVGV